MSDYIDKKHIFKKIDESLIVNYIKDNLNLFYEKSKEKRNFDIDR